MVAAVSLEVAVAVTKKSLLAEKLVLAATALIGGNVAANAIETNNDDDWQYSASILTYSEVDRVSAFEVITTADKIYGDSQKLSLKLVLDTLTGASANGAIEQSNVQTFTRPSGKGQFDTAANSTPLDDTFRDTRVQFNVSWTDAITEQSRYTVGSNLSKEYDYQSISANGELAFDFYNKNSTLAVGLSLGVDQYNPEGKIPIAFSSMVVDQGQFASRDDYWTAFDLTRSDSSDTTTTSELLIGWTQVISRKMLVQFNYGYANTSGYLTDPFKILSVVDLLGETQDLVYENRPDSRVQNSLFGLMKYHLDDSILNLSYRYLSNDWEIKSNTIDLRWHFFADNDSFWEPHLRFYQQDAAEFYTPFLADSAPLPEYASADYRLGEMNAVTVGLKYGFKVNGDSRAEVRLEYYQQSNSAANQVTGIENLQGFDLYPDVEAIILQFNYIF